MPSDLIAAVEYGGYISLWKLLLFALAVFGWAPLVHWVFTDSQAVRTNAFTWTLAVVVGGAVALFLWLLIPVFFVGLLLYLIVLGGTAMAYITHRNSRVADFEKILSVEILRRDRGPAKNQKVAGGKENGKDDSGDSRCARRTKLPASNMPCLIHR